MRIRTKIKSGALTHNHNVRVRSNVKSGILNYNHNVRVRSNVKSGIDAPRDVHTGLATGK
jgi:hypothetical protein